MKFVWSASPYLLLLTTIINLINSLLPATQLYVNKLIIDQVILTLKTPEIPWNPVFIFVIISFGLAIAQDSLQELLTYFSQIMKDRFTLHANEILLKQAVHLDLAHYELPEFYDLLKRAQQSGSSYPVLALETATILLGQIIKLITLVGLLINFNPLISLFLLFTSIPTFSIGVGFSEKRFKMLKKQTQSGRFADYLQSIMTNNNFVKEVRLFNLENHLMGQWRTIRLQFNQEIENLAKKHARVNVLAIIFSKTGFYMAYAWVILKALQSQITIGDLSMYAGAFRQSQGAMQKILESIVKLYETNLYIQQFFEFLELTPKIKNPINPLCFPTFLQSGLVLDNVSFTYPGSLRPSLHHINLSVQPGENIALVGTNGAGKTTLLKLIARFYDVNSGQITFDGIPISKFDLVDLRRNIGVVFQDFARYNLSVSDNISFGNLDEYKNFDLIRQAAIDAGASEFIEQLDHGYQTMLGKMFPGGHELSGGQWQKIGLARAFMSPAQILILDEPTAALDAIAEYELFQRFRQLAKGKMTFLVSHRFSTVRMADRIVVLDQGSICEMGSHQELMDHNGLYAHMFKVQSSTYRPDLNPDSKPWFWTLILNPDSKPWF